MRREKFGEVVKLLGWITTDGKKKQKSRGWKDKNGNYHIRREAKNDNWY